MKRMSLVQILFLLFLPLCRHVIKKKINKRSYEVISKDIYNYTNDLYKSLSYADMLPKKKKIYINLAHPEFKVK
jgi:hypothetical protein